MVFLKVFVDSGALETSEPVVDNLGVPYLKIVVRQAVKADHVFAGYFTDEQYQRLAADLESKKQDFVFYKYRTSEDGEDMDYGVRLKYVNQVNVYTPSEIERIAQKIGESL